MEMSFWFCNDIIGTRRTRQVDAACRQQRCERLKSRYHVTYMYTFAIIMIIKTILPIYTRRVYAYKLYKLPINDCFQRKSPSRRSAEITSLIYVVFCRCSYYHRLNIYIIYNILYLICGTTSNNDSRRSSCEIYLRDSSKRLAHIFRVVADYIAGTTFLSVVTQPHIYIRVK